MFASLVTCFIILSTITILSLIAGSMVESSLGNDPFFEEHF